MAPKNLLVKRHGHLEEFDERKIYASVYAAALNAHLGEHEAEKMAEDVCATVSQKLRARESFTSEDIRDAIVEELGGEDNDVAYLYLHHLDIN